MKCLFGRFARRSSILRLIEIDVYVVALARIVGDTFWYVM